MRKYKIVIYFSLLLSPAVLMSERPTIHCFGKQVLGKIEQVVLLDKNVALNAKIDTGADMSSLSALNVHVFSKKNRTWVQFYIATSGSTKNLMLVKPVIRFVNIRKRSDETISTHKMVFIQRPVIALAIKLGNQQKTVLCNLINRQNFLYPMLLGADALKQFNAVVDVSRQHLVQ